MVGSTNPLDVGDFTTGAFTSSEFTAAAPSFIYPYKPLDDPRNEIRLLRYKGTSQKLASARLCFEVITVRCPSSPDDVVEPFYAVSYSWGTMHGLAEMILDGHEVDVPLSSEVALRGLITASQRGAGDSNMLIWIDAICMNQRDMAERENQVSLMGRLYKCAHSVCVWLGPAGTQTIAALQSLNALKNEKESWYEEHGKTATPPNGDLSTPSGCNWKALSSILAVPWFSRVWTIQEIVLARPGQSTVYCGRYSLSWDDFTIAAQWAWDTHRDVMPNDVKTKSLLPAMFMMRVKMRYDLEGGVQMSRLLTATISRGVTNQEDRIYGLLGMRPEAQAARGAIVENYGKPLSARYTPAAATIMETEESLFLLEQMAIVNRVGYSVGPEGESNWPTWVPRLDIQNMSWGDIGLSSPVTGVPASNASNNLPAPMIRSTPAEGLLHLRGLRVGEVELAFEALIKNKYLTTRIETNDWDSTEVARHCSYLWAPEWISNNSTRETIVAVADSLTVGGYQELNDNNETMIRDFGAMMHKGWELHSEEDRDNLLLPTFTQEGERGSIANFVENVAGRAPRFRHLKLSGEKFGMGPDNVLIGDIVVILLGINVPIVLRPKGERYSLLGAVYISGVMQGEYIRSLSTEELSDKTETFDIC